MPIQFLNRRFDGGAQACEEVEPPLSLSVCIILWRCTMTRVACLSTIAGIAAMGLAALPAHAQYRGMAAGAPVAAEAPAKAAPEPDAPAAASPYIFVVDSGRRLAMINVGTQK